MTGANGDRVLTSKGEATRRRILDVAADLFYELGSGGTTNERLRSAAGVSGSQLNHYFPTRGDLVDAVVRKRVADAVNPQRFAAETMPDSLASLRRWADVYLRDYETMAGGCRVGSLAGELAKTTPQSLDEIAAGFERWRVVLRDGLLTMRANGELRDDADADELSWVLLAALQGGSLLLQVSGSADALRAALDGALRVVAGFAVESG